MLRQQLLPSLRAGRRRGSQLTQPRQICGKVRSVYQHKKQSGPEGITDHQAHSKASPASHSGMAPSPDSWGQRWNSIITSDHNGMAASSDRQANQRHKQNTGSQTRMIVPSQGRQINDRAEWQHRPISSMTDRQATGGSEPVRGGIASSPNQSCQDAQQERGTDKQECKRSCKRACISLNSKQLRTLTS